MEDSTMQIACLRFNLDDSDDKKAHLRAVKATDAYIVLWDTFQFMRTIIKYGDDEKEAEVMEKLRDYMQDKMDEYGISMNDIS
jgi:hypothetical protein